MSRMVTRTISFSGELLAQLEAEAVERGVTLSAVVVEASKQLLHQRRGLSAIAEFERKFGPLTQKELRLADRALDAALASARRPDVVCSRSARR